MVASKVAQQIPHASGLHTENPPQKQWNSSDCLPKPSLEPGPSEIDEHSTYDPQTGLFVNPETGDVVDVWAAAEESGVMGAD